MQLDGGGGRRRGLKPDINVTPLVDVVLVLLIIFMVVLPDMNDEGKPIDLVQVATGEEPKNADQQLVVTIDREAGYSVDDVEMSREQALAKILETSGKTVVLRADSGLRYGEVRAFMAQVQEAGLRGLRFAVGSRREWNQEGG